MSARPILVDVTEKSVTTTITPTEVDALPLLGRRFVDLAALAPGVTRDYANVTSSTDSIAFGGVCENYKSLWFEGVDIGDEATGGGTNLWTRRVCIFRKRRCRSFRSCRRSTRSSSAVRRLASSTFWARRAPTSGWAAAIIS